jgi:energy-coupling factor transporter ATP-binding protein EcfA2
MAITRIEIENFLAFQKLEADFSPGINVFIGENSTGKSHLMKLIYSLIKPLENARFDTPKEPERLKMNLEEKLKGVFKPQEGRLGRLVSRRVGRGSAQVTLFHGEHKIAFSLSNLDAFRPVTMSLSATPPSIFLPSRETLAMFPGFIPLYESRELSIDETYYDLCKALSANPLRGPRMEAAKKLIAPLENILGGKVALEGGSFFLRSEIGMGIIEAHLLAEGYRKIASLIHLIANGTLMKNAVLFWDEPEANLNPRLVTKIATVLRSLAHKGIQVFMATHDFLLSNELAMAVEYKTDPVVPIKFFCFSRQKPDSPVKVAWADQLAELHDNPILQEFAAHYDRERDLLAGNLLAKGAANHE